MPFYCRAPCLAHVLYKMALLCSAVVKKQTCTYRSEGRSWDAAAMSFVAAIGNTSIV